MFGEMVRAHRRRLGMTQEDLASATGVSVRGIRNLETGRVSAPRPATARLLADTFGLREPERGAFLDAAAAAGPTEPVPAQLPRQARGFAGRVAELAVLNAAMDGDGPGAVVFVVTGTAGVGKTALALHWAHRMASRFPDGQLYVDLRGFDPTGSVMDHHEAVRGFLDALRVPAHRIPPGFEAQVGLYRSLLAGRRMLLVLDNAAGAEQVRPLLPGAQGCLVAVTSRDQLAGLVAIEGAHPINLDLLSTEEARQLLAGRLGQDRVAAETHAVDEIISSCARLPLALVVAAARAATHAGLSLTELAGELREAHGGLDVLDGGDAMSSVRAVFSWSYRSLSSEAARLFRLLGLHPGPDIGACAVASLAAVPVRRARPLLAELTRAHLVDEHLPDRYAFHDLLRAYATELAHMTDSETERNAATHRILDHLLHTGHAAAMLINPQRDPIDLTPPGCGVTPEELADDHRAQGWFTAERPALLAGISRAAASGFDVHAWQIAWTLVDFLDRRGHVHDLATAQRTALAALRRLGDRPGLARGYRLLSLAEARLGCSDEARDLLRTSLDICRELGDRRGQANAHISIAFIASRHGEHREALRNARQAEALFRAEGDRTWHARALNDVGWYQTLLGDHEAGIAYCEQALALFRDLGDRYGEANAYDSLGHAHHRLGHHHRAITFYRHSLDLFHQLGDRHYEAEVLERLGDVHHDTGDLDATRLAWQQSLDIFRELDQGDATKLRDKLHTLDASPTPTQSRRADRAAKS